MKKRILITLLLIVIVLAARSFAASPSKDFDADLYGSEIFDDWRQLTYWGKVSLSVRDYQYGLGDAEFLKLVTKDKTSPIRSENPRDDLKNHFVTGFRRLFGNLPFHDLDEGRWKREEQFRRDNPQWDYFGKPSVSIGDAIEAFNAAELARRKGVRWRPRWCTILQCSSKAANFPCPI